MSVHRQRPRLLALVTDGFSGHGGIAQYNRDLLSALAERWDVHVLARYDVAPIDLPAGVIQHPSCRRRPDYARAALGWARRLQPAVVFAGHVHFAGLARWAARLAGSRLVVQTHGVDVWSSPKAWNRAAVESADLVLAVSRHTRRCVLSWAELPPERVRVLPNTVRPIFKPGDRSAARARFACDGQPLIVTVGRLSADERYKGHDRVIAALPVLRRRWPGVRYCIAGRGNDRERLEALATQHEVGAAVEFLDVPGDEELADLYRAADVMALPSTGEGFGIAYLEALSCGTAVVGLDAGGAADPLSVFPPGLATEATLATVLMQVLAEPAPVADAIRTALVERFGRSTYTTVARALFDTLIAGDRN